MEPWHILDMTAGWRALWFEIGDAVLMDRRIECTPHVVADWKHLPFKDGSFDIVLFDPPHKGFTSGYLAESYGRCTLEDVIWDMQHGAREAWRVTRNNALMVLKWATPALRLDRVLTHLPRWKPRFGQRTRSRPDPMAGTFWVLLERE